jgi:hypothetical protein
MTNIYTLIAYTPGESGWIDRCGDFKHGTDSELTIHYFNEIKDIGKWWARNEFEDSNREHTVLINGVNIDDTCVMPDEKISEYQSIYYEIEDVRFNEYQAIKKIREESLLAEQAKKKQEEELNLKKAQEKLEATEKQQLATLIAKYGK